jgi:hypothetical protein
MSAIQTAQGIILFGAENVDNRTVSGSLSDLGISLIRLSTYDCHAIAVPSLSQFRYGLYKSNLPAFMAATDGETKSLIEPFHPVSSEDRVLDGFRLPSIIFGFEAAMADEIKQELLNQTGCLQVREVVRGGGRIAYILDNVPLSSIGYLAKLPGINHITPTYDNTSNIAALPDYTLALRIARKFTSLHAYPAFMDEDHLKTIRAKFLEGKDVIRLEDDLTEFADPPAGGQILESELAGVNAWVGRTARGGATAPAQQAGEPLFEDVTTIDLGGYYAPFILDLAQYDTQTVPHAIQQHFVGCLGEDNEEAAGNLRLLKSSFGILGKTDQGKALAHLFKCINLAIEGQLSIRVHYDEVIGYKGCVLLGFGSRIEVEKRVISWAPKDSLRQTVSRADYHTRAIATIIASLGLSEEDAVRLSNCKTFSEMRVLLSVAATTSTQRTTIIQAAQQLRLPQISWRVNAETFQRLFYLLTSSDPLPVDLPIHPSRLFSEDRLEILLSCFGDFAPSFKVPGGREMSLETAQSRIVTQKAGQKVTEMKTVTKLGCRSVPLETAIADWAWMKENKKIYNPFAQPKVKSSAEYFTRFFDGNNMQMILDGLRKFCDVVQVTGAGPSGKRKATESGEDAGSSKKKHRGFF